MGSKKLTAIVLSVTLMLGTLFFGYFSVSADETANNDTVIINGVEYVETFFDDLMQFYINRCSYFIRNALSIVIETMDEYRESLK